MHPFPSSPTCAHGIGFFLIEDLTAALRALPGLEVFHWHGQRPKPSSAIFQALGAGSLTTLTEIRIP